MILQGSFFVMYPPLQWGSQLPVRIIAAVNENVFTAVFLTHCQIFFVLPDQFLRIKAGIIQPRFDGVGMVADGVELGFIIFF